MGQHVHRLASTPLPYMPMAFTVRLGERLEHRVGQPVALVHVFLGLGLRRRRFGRRRCRRR
jgi:hypothetical protein